MFEVKSNNRSDKFFSKNEFLARKNVHCVKKVIFLGHWNNAQKALSSHVGKSLDSTKFEQQTEAKTVYTSNSNHDFYTDSTIFKFPSDQSHN